MDTIADFMDRAFKIAVDVSKDSGKALKEFLVNLEKKEEDFKKIRQEVHNFSKQFPIPGVDVTKY